MEGTVVRGAGPNVVTQMDYPEYSVKLRSPEGYVFTVRWVTHDSPDHIREQCAVTYGDCKVIEIAAVGE